MMKLLASFCRAKRASLNVGVAELRQNWLERELFCDSANRWPQPIAIASLRAMREPLHRRNPRQQPSVALHLEDGLRLRECFP